MVIRRLARSYLVPLLALCLLLGIFISASPALMSPSSFAAARMKSQIVDFLAPYLVVAVVLVFTIATVDWFLPSITTSGMVVRKKIEAYRNRGGVHLLYHGWMNDSPAAIDFTREMYLHLPLNQPISLERTPLLKKVKELQIPQLVAPEPDSLTKLIAEEKKVGGQHFLSQQVRILIVLIILGFIVINFVTLDFFSL
ncbi:hypothetical protein KBD71_05485 [Candidatus Woesebacteria bacterium]|nr:hypothetical protein [Candidatus Woesebacteria bacterium]